MVSRCRNALFLSSPQSFLFLDGLGNLHADQMLLNVRTIALEECKVHEPVKLHVVKGLDFVLYS